MIDKQAVKLAIHAMTDAEVAHEAKQVEQKAKQFQSIASTLRREIKRRKRKAHVTQ